MSDSMKEVVETLDPVSQRLLPRNIDTGTLVPLKTTLELRDNLLIGQTMLRERRQNIPMMSIIRAMVGDDQAKNLPHLRRCSKPSDLPPHLKNQFMNESQSGRGAHTGKSQYLYILLGPQDELDYGELVRGLSAIPGIRDDLFVGLIPVPLLAPTSQVQANLWSQQFWQTVYRKNNPLGPHPSNICRTTSVVSRDADIWMTLAHDIARKSQKAGFGEPIGAVIVKRTIPGKPEHNKPDQAKAEYGKMGDGTGGLEPAFGDASDSGSGNDYEKVDAAGLDNINTNQTEDAAVEQKERVDIVALAGDARWHRQERTGHTGNPMAHAALRAISMVAQKTCEVREAGARGIIPNLGVVFDADHPSPDGYLCHELELYMTHEPCIMCAMAILHSRMGKIVFRHRMPLTGGMSSEDRSHDLCGGPDAGCEHGPCGGGHGLGLHWRKELNWSMLGWEWETDKSESLPVDVHLHA
ncbi:Cytidine and deoxycytidylate deaminase zinc-binding region [Apiospora hydei]|uniref:Cytidine and deoxycytidylate deaminase zinc-binding region n=1 Tax=Apiospora hydei TaxID=1337664 RepID=A0ABR1XCV3_9PEZI